MHARARTHTLMRRCLLSCVISIESSSAFGFSFMCSYVWQVDAREAFAVEKALEIGRLTGEVEQLRSEV